jgi:23S rRNA (cytidine1920-2'-O)/16S rRNA (cytidine1409-2'-O)-methyltransferase
MEMPHPAANQSRIRLDHALVERGLCSGREKAKRAIMAGEVKVNGQVAHKASEWITQTDAVTLATPEKFVSRGGYKLEHGLNHFGLEVANHTAIDLGASTGGFTDCLLQRGVEKVYAVDVGQGQLAWKLRQDPKVIVMERINARLLRPADFPTPFQPVDLVVIDCSFISLRKIVPASVALLKPLGKILALIKPQFEAGKAEADRGAGVIRDPRVHERVLSELAQFVAGLGGLRWVGTTPSPVLGPAGNREFLVLLERLG